jgi:hypothetical protein
MIAAMNAGQVTDADGTDELQRFQVRLFHDDVYQHDIFGYDLTFNATGTEDANATSPFIADWKQTFKGNTEAYKFEYTDDCYI